MLQVHNRQASFGGADVVIENERQALERRGHVVRQFFIDTRDVLDRKLGQAQAALASVWNSSASRALDNELAEFGPDVVHFHTIFPVASPSILRVPRRFGVASVLTHHSYRVGCVSGTLEIGGDRCTRCVGRAIKLDAVRNRCYHNSVAGSASLATGLAVHKKVGSWDGVDLHIALTDFGKDIIKRELPSASVRVAPNFLLDRDRTEFEAGLPLERERLLFLGRLDATKGVAELLRHAAESEIRLTVAGSGPMEREVRRVAETSSTVNFVGSVAHREVPPLIRSHEALVISSRWEEACPMSILETYAQGRPVLSAAQYQYADLVLPGETGEHFRLESTSDFSDAADRLFRSSRSNLYAKIPDHFEHNYSEAVGVERLEDCYREAMGRATSVAGDR